MRRIIFFLVSALAALTCMADLPTANPRGGNTPIAELNLGNYAYVPSVMADGVYKIWYCSSPSAGDHIYYSESSNLDSGWSAPVSVFQGTGSADLGGTPNQSAFDRVHTCDPSVIRPTGWYLMYYGGTWSLEPTPGRTAIGVAYSADGKTNWTRANNGQPIIRAKNDFDGEYGAGQPSVFYHAGWYYLLYLDTSTENTATSKPDVNKMFVLRSTDFLFQQNVYERQATGWVLLPDGTSPARTYSPFPVGRSGLEWRYDDMLGAIAVAFPDSSCHENCPPPCPFPDNCADTVSVLYYDLDINAVLDGSGAQLRATIPGKWSEGMGFVRRHDGHAPPAFGTTYTCGTVPVDIVRSVGTLGSPGTFRLAHTGADYLVPCDRSRNGAVFDGVLVNGGPVGLPLMFVRANLRLQLATIPTAFKLAHAVYDLTSSADFFAIPYGSSLYYGQEAMIAPGTPGAFRTDSDTPGVVRRWAVSCPGILTANGSALHNVTAEYFNAALPSPDLYCVN